VDEANCNFEKVTLCAFNQTKVGQAGVSTRADFLICIDETKETNDAVAAATPCAAKSSLDMPTIKTCYNGAQGMALLTTASTLWNHYFPSPTTIPKIVVNGKVVSEASYAAIKEAICAAGSTAPACKSTLLTSTI